MDLDSVGLDCVLDIVSLVSCLVLEGGKGLVLSLVTGVSMVTPDDV